MTGRYSSGMLLSISFVGVLSKQITKAESKGKLRMHDWAVPVALDVGLKALMWLAPTDPANLALAAQHSAAKSTTLNCNAQTFLSGLGSSFY